MTGHEKVTLVTLNTTSIEYQDVLRKFQATVPHVKVQRIERVQNPELYRTFMGKKQEMDKRCGGNSERRLFHGTDGKSITAINSQGFNRNFCGKNGRCIQEPITGNRLLVHLITISLRTAVILRRRGKERLCKQGVLWEMCKWWIKNVFNCSLDKNTYPMLQDKKIKSSAKLQ